jgi:CDGSH-type Zn-finger protein/uncharacterized Fe-S cluster protein YjdI
MGDSIERVRGKHVLLQFEAKRCIHSRHCVLERPDVFVPNVEGEWIHPDAVPVEDVVKIAEICPSGAIRYERLDGGANEAAPVVNLVRVRENGPLAFRGELRIAGAKVGYRATLCRCGASQNKPYCDGSHNKIGFSASGEPASQDSPALAVRNGPLEVTPTLNGPLKVSGNLELVSGTGRTVKKMTACALCRCGGSQNKPFCDGSHNKNGFNSES